MSPRVKTVNPILYLGRIGVATGRGAHREFGDRNSLVIGLERSTLKKNPRGSRGHIENKVANGVQVKVSWQ